MAYATIADLVSKWGGDTIDLLSWSAIANGREDARLIAGLNQASATIDAYLGRRYAMPPRLTDQGALVLQALCCDLAVGVLATAPATRTDIVADAERRAMAQLRDLADGAAALPILSQQPEISPGEAVMIADARIMTGKRLQGL